VTKVSELEAMKLPKQLERQAEEVELKVFSEESWKVTWNPCHFFNPSKRSVTFI
jgi:hypothetical protein